MKRIESLDLFRGMAGYGVAVCHYYTYLFNSSNFEYLSFLFVDLFFVLSRWANTILQVEEITWNPNYNK